MCLQRVIAAVCLVGLLFGRLAAAEFKLIDGNVFRGELVAADENGFVIRLDNGSFAPRTDWGKMTDETLMALALAASTGITLASNWHVIGTE